jgi:hypothetical protein
MQESRRESIPEAWIGQRRGRSSQRLDSTVRQLPRNDSQEANCDIDQRAESADRKSKELRSLNQNYLQPCQHHLTRFALIA